MNWVLRAAVMCGGFGRWRRHPPGGFGTRPYAVDCGVWWFWRVAAGPLGGFGTRPYVVHCQARSDFGRVTVV